MRGRLLPPALQIAISCGDEKAAIGGDHPVEDGRRVEFLFADCFPRASRKHPQVDATLAAESGDGFGFIDE